MLLARWFPFGLYFVPECGGEMFFRNVGRLSTDYTALLSQKAKLFNLTWVLFIIFIIINTVSITIIMNFSLDHLTISLVFGHFTFL
jgi:hypothetical protein